VEPRAGELGHVGQPRDRFVGVVEDRSDQLIEAEPGARTKHSEALHPLGLVELLLEALLLFHDARPLDRIAQAAMDQRPRLEFALAEVVLCARLERAQRQIVVPGAREHHDRHGRVGLAQPAHGIAAGAVGEMEVEQDDVGISLAEQVDPLGERGRALEPDALERAELALEPPRDEQRITEIVFDE
jgi:hypothetical protein